ncbi:hypothetical protein IIA15_08015 [candidate division TA06 bacterium]|nr:hypothetical protein [candidate division TA06 bacterium]
MVIYGFYGFLFVAGWGFMATLIFLREVEVGMKVWGQMDLSKFFLFPFFFFLTLFGLITGGFNPLFEGNLPVLGGALLVLLLPLLLVFLYGWAQERRSPERQKIEGLKKRAAMDPDDPAPHIALARIYEKSSRWGEAIQAYQRVYDLYSEVGYRSKFQRKINHLQPRWEKEEREKTHECKACHVNNYPRKFYCEECGSPLYHNPFHWASAFLPMKWILGIITILFLFYLLGGIALFFVLPVFLVFLFLHSIKNPQRKKRELEERIEVLKNRLEEDPKNPIFHRNLSKIYEGLRRPKEALQELKMAYDLIPEDQSGYRWKLGSEIVSLEKLWKKEEGKKTLECRACRANNNPSMRNCEACNTPLYKNVFLWAYTNFDPKGKVVIIVLPFLFSPFIFWLPFKYYLSLTLIWLFDVLYFFYPHERFTTSWE